MAVVGSRKTYSSFKNKGYVDSANHADDHKFLEYRVGGRVVASTKMSHGSNFDLTSWDIKNMSQQCGLKKEQFLEFARCDMTEEQYFGILQEKGWIEPSAVFKG
jgi:anaerobic selenocysteine-containing dehydrogenase